MVRGTAARLGAGLTGRSALLHLQEHRNEAKEGEAQVSAKRVSQAVGTASRRLRGELAWHGWHPPAGLGRGERGTGTGR